MLIFKTLSSKIKILLATCIVVSLLVTVIVSNLSISAAANANPTWYVGERLIKHGQANPYDYYAAKDPTIVYAEGKYHVFYTGANQSGGWQMLYTSATTLDGLKTAPRTFMNSINEGYFCAPQVFYFEPQNLWYLVYQDGTHGAAYATTKTINDPASWSGPKKFNISGNTGLDYFIICDDNYAYMYNSPDDRKIYMRKTSLDNFPNGWGSPSVAINDSWEGHTIYKSLADGKYYLMSEDYSDGRYYELWTSSSAGGPWTQISEKWAWRGNLSYEADKWTTNVSHGEVIRAGYNQKMEINDINKVDFLIQGTTSQSGEYQQINWDLGIIKNYKGSSNTPNATTIAPTNTTSVTSTIKPTTNTVTTNPTTIPTPIQTDSNLKEYAVNYLKQDWGSGGNVTFTINNNSKTTINGWTIDFQFAGNQKITNMWNATYTQNGNNVTIKNVDYNSIIPANGSLSFGYGLSYSGSNDIPTSIVLNGIQCQIN